MNVNVLHELLGHLSKATTRLMTKNGYDHDRYFSTCEACALGKAKKMCPSQSTNDQIL